MSFLTDDDVNKRARNLFPALVSAEPPNAVVTARFNALNMVYYGDYLALVPGVGAITGSFEGATLGPNITTPDNDTLTFSGESSGLGESFANSTVDSVCWEIEVSANNGTLALGAFVGIAGVTTDYFSEQYIGNASMTPPQNGYYETQIASGIIGIVITTAQYWIFLDGVQIQGPTALNFPVRVRPVASFLPA